MWIASPARDGLFFFASVLVVPVVWFAATVLHVDSMFILGAVAATSNGPHLVSTWTRVYFDAREWRARPIALVGVPLLIMAAVAVIVVQFEDTGARLLNSAILYWATWHFVAQNWGLLRIYQRKSGEALSSLALRFEKPLLLLFVAWCLLHRIETGPRVLFGTEVFHPTVPKALTDALLAPIVVLFVVILVQRLREWRQPWAPAAWLRLGFLGCAAVGFFVPFVFITTDDTSAFAAAAAWHGFQYLGIVREYHRNTWRGGLDPKAKLVSWLGQPDARRGALYFALLLALAGGVYAVIFLVSLLTEADGWGFTRLAAVVWVGLTLSHYWLDGVIWKLRRPELAARVGIVSEGLTSPG